MAEDILAVKGVTVGFDGFMVLNGLDFSMKKGELRFLIGPNGAGKTTLLDIITGKTKPQKGEVIFDGVSTTRIGRNEHRLVRLGIGRKFQTPSVFGSLSVRENLVTAIGFREATVNLVRSAPKDEVSRVEETLDLIGLKSRATLRAAMLSHGEKQWLEIGMLLVQQPQLLLLDEPVAGMTRQERNRTGELVQEIAKNRSVLVVEHDMEFVRRFATTVTVLHGGTRLCEGPVEEVQNDDRVIEVYLGKKRDRSARAA
ncbi:MAG: urea ABC transporter ATP-binding protein UrtD [Chloroflexi bacterium]|nr:urea ABC transporter ATP-binding protein UrtD [Chloroflexota bacterium]